ncbi:MAG: glycoside hydrolase family 19 protein [Beijerinckiaceae bacterium]
MSQMLEALKALGPNGKRDIINALASAAPRILAQYGITTPLRLAHFWAQASHECAGFRTMYEYWGPTAAQKRYEGRKDLGNTQPGDGFRFRGRGIFQLTGRFNYADMSRKLGLDLVAKPDLAADPEVALRIACEYWKSRNLNALADKNDIVAITKKINGGTNGLADRRANYVIAWRIFGEGEGLPPPGRKITESKEGNAAALAGAGAGLAAVNEAARTVKETSDNVSSVSGLFSDPTFIILALVVVACGAIWYWRKRRLQEDG